MSKKKNKKSSSYNGKLHISDSSSTVQRHRMEEVEEFSKKRQELDKPIPAPAKANHSELEHTEKPAKKSSSAPKDNEVVFYSSTPDYDAPIPPRPATINEDSGENTLVDINNPVFSAGEEDDEDFVDISSASATAASAPAPASAKKKAPRTAAAAKDNTHKTAGGNEKKKKPVKRVVISVICCILAALMIISGTGCVVLYSFLSSYNYQAIDSEMSNLTSKSEPGVPGKETNNTNAYEGKLKTDNNILNVLLIGADTRRGETKGNSDTMILLSIDTKNKKLKLLSFMRDTWVTIPGYDDNKLNAAFTFGGAELTVKTIQANYGILIDRYAIVDFKSFKNIIDKLGGIDVELTQEEVDYIDWQTWTNNQADTRNELDAYSYEYKPNSKGDEVAKVHLNGRQALWHARNRGEDGICSGDDYVRTLRQRNVIGIVINKLKKTDTTTLLSTISEIGSMITTNLKSSEIIQLANNLSKYFKYEIVSQSAPDSDSFGTDYVYSDYYENPVYVYGDFVSAILIMDWDDFRQKIADFVFNDENRLDVPEQTEQTEESTEAAGDAAAQDYTAYE